MTASEADETQSDSRMLRMMRESFRRQGRPVEEADEFFRETMEGIRASFGRPRLEREPRHGDKNNPLNLIDEFVNRRKKEAKAALQPIKDRVDSSPQRKALRNRLYSPTTPLTDHDMYDLYEQLRRGEPTLGKKWHGLLEVCYELTIQVDIVETASDCLHPEIYQDLPPERAGLFALHNYRSWFMHGFALAEWVRQAIEKTVLLYTTKTVEKNALLNPYKRRIAREVINAIREERNEFAHAIKSDAGSSMTSAGFWESSLRSSRTLADKLFATHYVAHARMALEGDYYKYIRISSIPLDHLGTILQDFERGLLGLRLIRALRAEIGTRS